MRILLIRLREIGDVVFTTPAVRALRDRFPDAHLSYVVEPVAEAVIRANPCIDEVILAPRKSGLSGLGHDLALGARLRRGRYDVVIDFHGGPRASLFAWLSRAPKRIGYEVVGRGWMYSTRVPRARELRARHSVENQWDLLTPLGVAPPGPDQHPVEMSVEASAQHAVVERLAAAGVAPTNPLVVIHVSAGNPFRRWPIDAFAEVAAALASDPRAYTVVLTSGPSDRDAAGLVIDAARSRLAPELATRIVKCGDFTLIELRALVERAALYIGGDSGPMHIAATSRVPILALYGPTLPARSAPWRPGTYVSEAVEINGLPCRPCHQRHCEPGDFRCLTGIDPSQVLMSAKRALARAEITTDTAASPVKPVR